ncbi:MAG: 4Fe-4S binding protein [Coriobacteriales bacterium]|nr:4Fe-4S binding protein [Coriobacteriales bacterium]
MKVVNIRTIVVLILIAVITIGYITNYSIGTFSAVGWREFALLCPLGAFETMLASKTFVGKALVSLIATVVLFALCGRAFCSWICPIPLVSRLPDFIKKRLMANKTTTHAVVSERAALADKAGADEQVVKPKVTESIGNSLVKAKCSSGSSHCSACHEKRGHLDSRHIVLGASLLSAFVFGFPVFCAICPLGLTIASILLVVQLFAIGEVTWTLLFAPLVLVIEVIFFRKWCQVFCPLSAITSLLSKATVTMKLRIDDKKCLETSQNRKCSACASVCPERINPRHPEKSYSLMCECTKCYECVQVCPTKALKIPFLPWKTGSFARVSDKHKEKKD